MRPAVRAQRHRAIEARAAAGVAGARAGLLDLDPDRVLVAVDAHLDDALGVAGALALAPERLLRERLKYHASPVSMVRRQRLGIHVRDHQHVAGRRVGRDAGDEPVGVELRREGACPPRPLAGEPGGANRGAYRARPAAPARGDRTRAGSTLQRPRTIVMKRTCSVGSSRNEPVNCVVTVERPGFCTPRSDMHICSASSITATPRGLRISSIAVAICEVRCSCVCRRLAIDVDQARELGQADHLARPARRRYAPCR